MRESTVSFPCSRHHNEALCPRNKHHSLSLLFLCAPECMAPLCSESAFLDPLCRIYSGVSRKGRAGTFSTHPVPCARGLARSPLSLSCTNCLQATWKWARLFLALRTHRCTALHYSSCHTYSQRRVSIKGLISETSVTIVGPVVDASGKDAGFLQATTCLPSFSCDRYISHSAHNSIEWQEGQALIKRPHLWRRAGLLGTRRQVHINSSHYFTSVL